MVLLELAKRQLSFRDEAVLM